MFKIVLVDQPNMVNEGGVTFDFQNGRELCIV